MEHDAAGVVEESHEGRSVVAGNMVHALFEKLDWHWQGQRLQALRVVQQR